jgi:hypothetical protein
MVVILSPVQARNQKQDTEDQEAQGTQGMIAINKYAVIDQSLAQIRLANAIAIPCINSLKICHDVTPQRLPMLVPNQISILYNANDKDAIT